jgi:hypothetical protein
MYFALRIPVSTVAIDSNGVQHVLSVFHFETMPHQTFVSDLLASEEGSCSKVTFFSNMEVGKCK